MIRLRPPKGRGDLRSLDGVCSRFTKAWGGPAEWDVDHFVDRWSELLKAGGSILLMAEQEGEPVGVAAAVLGDYVFSPTTAAFEVLWWVDESVEPGPRGLALMRMERKLAEWAKRHGAKSLYMTRFPRAGEKIDRVLARVGYEQAEIGLVRSF